MPLQGLLVFAASSQLSCLIKHFIRIGFFSRPQRGRPQLRRSCGRMLRRIFKYAGRLLAALADRSNDQSTGDANANCALLAAPPRLRGHAAIQLRCAPDAADDPQIRQHAERRRAELRQHRNFAGVERFEHRLPIQPVHNRHPGPNQKSVEREQGKEQPAEHRERQAGDASARAADVAHGHPAEDGCAERGRQSGQQDEQGAETPPPWPSPVGKI